jgi:rod shape-determining protein MreD
VQLRLIALFALATLVALAIQTIVPFWLPIGAFMPNLVLILAVDLGFRHASALGAVMAFAMGYATDALSGSHLGLNAFTVTLAFLIAYEISRHLLTTNDLVGALAVLLGVLINALGGLALTSNLGALTDPGGVVGRQIAVQAAISATLSPPIFALMNRARRGLGIALPKRARVD